jgi:oligosaccharide repeat unit polymerase
MVLLIYFTFLVALFGLKKRTSPALLLAGIYLFSLLCGVPLGYDYPMSTLRDWINVAFVAAMLTLLIAPWSAFPFRADLAPPNDKRVLRLTWALIALHIVGLYVFATIFYAAFTTVTDYSAFKESGSELGTFYQSLPINHNVFLLSTYLNGTAAFLVPLHFYHLMHRRYPLALLSLLLSLNIILEGISIFSRSTLIFYVSLYLLYLPFFYHRLERKQRLLLKGVGVVAVSLLGAVFYVITNNRFAYLLAGDQLASSAIKNPVVYSVLDYASQWYKNGSEVLAAYSFKHFNGELSFPIVPIIADKIGLLTYSSDALPVRLELLWGDRYDEFVGIIPNLVFDFGYPGAVLFVGLYAFGLRSMRPMRHGISLATLTVLGPLFLLPALGIENSVMKIANFNLLLLGSVGVYAYLYSKPGINHPAVVREAGPP